MSQDISLVEVSLWPRCSAAGMVMLCLSPDTSRRRQCAIGNSAPEDHRKISDSKASHSRCPVSLANRVIRSMTDTGRVLISWQGRSRAASGSRQSPECIILARIALKTGALYRACLPPFLWLQNACTISQINMCVADSMIV